MLAMHFCIVQFPEAIFSYVSAKQKVHKMHY